MITDLDIEKLKKIFLQKLGTATQVITSIIQWANITGKPTVFPPDTHTHVKADVTDFAHTHEATDITDLNEGLVGTKEVDETDIADTKILEYDSVSGKLIYVNKPSSAGYFNKLDATTDPTVNDDSGDGYEVGSLWFNVSTSKVFQCLDATATSAVWVELTGGGGGVPNGGTTGQVLAKLSNTDGDADWQTILSLYNSDEADTYFGALGTPLSGTQESRIRELVIRLKEVLGTNDLSTRIDCLWIFANETKEAALLNLIKRAHDVTETVAATWAQWEGFTGNGSSQYMDSNYNPNTQGVAFTLNNCFAGVYIRSTLSSSAMNEIGSWEKSPANTLIHLECRATNLCNHRLNNLNITSISNSYSNGGWFSASRTSSTQISRYAHLTSGLELYNSDTNVTISIPNLNLFILALNEAGTASRFSNRQVSVLIVGSGLSKQEEDSIHYVIENYMDSIGKGIL